MMWKHIRRNFNFPIKFLKLTINTTTLRLHSLSVPLRNCSLVLWKDRWKSKGDKDSIQVTPHINRVLLHVFNVVNTFLTHNPQTFVCSQGSLHSICSPQTVNSVERCSLIETIPMYMPECIYACILLHSQEIQVK